jgi:hypothetical protein
VFGFHKDFVQFQRVKRADAFFKIPADDLQLNYPVVTAPAAQTIIDVQDTSKLVCDTKGRPNILWTQCELFGKKVQDFDPNMESFETSRAYTKSYFASLANDAKPLTIPRMLNGERNPNVKAYYGLINPMELDASCGLYFNVVHKIQKKGDIFERSGNNNIVVRNNAAGADFIRQFAEADAMLKCGIVPTFLHRACQKQEILPIEKVAIGKTRCFVNCDPVLNSLQRKYTAEVVAQWQAQRANIPPQRGCNPYVEFTHIRQALDDFEGDEIEFDYSRFDRNSVYTYMWDFFDIICNSMDPSCFESEIEQNHLSYFS